MFLAEQSFWLVSGVKDEGIAQAIETCHQDGAASSKRCVKDEGIAQAIETL